jgi:hypothetical protein
MKRTTMFSAWLLAVAACVPSEPGIESTDPVELPLFTLSEPKLEIGLIDGDDEYLFGAIESVLQLADGRVAVSDGGTSKVSLYDSDGRFSGSFGGEGDGPGEFRALSHLYSHGTDSLRALDRRTGLVSSFDTNGEYGGQVDGYDLSQDSTFSLDAWLYRRFWVDGALEATQRVRVKAALDRLPPPRLSPGYRVVRVARDGTLFVREPVLGLDGTREWTAIDAAGDAVAVVQMPGQFEPMDIYAGEMLGRWTGESGVEFVRVYELGATDEVRPVPAWLTGAASAITMEVPAKPDELMELMRGAIRQMASKQEMHYSSNMTYTTQLDSLSFEQPEGLEVGFVMANARGWSAVFTHPGMDRLCALAFGFVVPPGWTPGSIVCAPEASTTATDANG